MKERNIMSESMNFVAEYIKKISKELDSENINKLIKEIINAKKIFLMGAGRSGLEARSFAMRLMHLGFSIYVVGDVTAPVPTHEDLVIIISGSGETRSIIDLGVTIKDREPKLAIITTKNGSSLTEISDIIIIIPVIIEDIDKDLRECFLPMGTLFEVVTHVFLDAIISELKYNTRTTEINMKDRHMSSEYVGIM